MAAIAPVRVRHGLEHAHERRPHLRPTVERPAVGLRSGGGLEHAIVGEQAHESVDVMAVPRVGVFDEQPLQLVVLHVRPPGFGLAAS